MPTSFTVTLLGKDSVLSRFSSIAREIPLRLTQEMKNQMVALSDYVRGQKLSGQVLNRRSGDLSRSVTGQSSLSGNVVVGQTGTKGVPYAGIHEFGAVFQREVTQAFGRPIIPVTATFHYPERSFLRSAANERMDQIRGALQDVVNEAFHAT